MYSAASESYLTSEASTGRHYVDLNAAMNTYRGAWLYGREHVQVYVGRMKAEWEQFCPVPADIRDGVLMKGNVLYRKSNGGWNRSGDQFEGVLRTEHGRGGGRYFVGKTQHTFFGSNLPSGKLTVVANLSIPLSHKSPQNPLVPVSSRPSAPTSQPSYQQNTYTPPTLSYPSYDSDGAAEY